MTQDLTQDVTLEVSTDAANYWTKAASVYDKLAPLVLNSNNYWQVGNVLDTLIDFLAVAIRNPQSTFIPIDAQAFMQEVLSRYNIATFSYNGGAGDWYDDFGWWGIASSKAYLDEYKDVFGATASGYQKIAQSCWGLMTNGTGQPGRKGAPNVWTQCDKTLFSSVEPNFNGGVWQTDITTSLSPINIPSKNISYANLGPYQNTVVNGLYFVLGLRLLKHASTRRTVEATRGFLTSWCFDASLSTQNKLLQYPNGTSRAEGLILERITIYKNGQRVNPTAWRDATTCWAGDQGLILGGMVGYMASMSDEIDTTPEQEIITHLLKGVGALMKDNNGVVSPWYPLSNNSLQITDSSDYSSGCGVFMRYLLYAFNNSTIVRTELQNSSSPLRTVLLNSTSAVVNGTFPGYGNYMFDLFNQLSTLTTAISVL